MTKKQRMPDAQLSKHVRAYYNAHGWPEGGDIKIKRFTKKGAPPGGSELIEVSVGGNVVDRFMLLGRKLIHPPFFDNEEDANRELLKVLTPPDKLQ